MVDYPITPRLKEELPKTINYSVGGIRLKMLDKISWYKHHPQENPLGYKKSAVEELYAELFEND